MNHSVVILQVLAGMINISRKEDGVSLKGIKGNDSFMFFATSQWDRRVDDESKQLAINRNVPKLKNKSLGASHLLTCFIAVCVYYGDSLNFCKVLCKIFGTIPWKHKGKSDFWLSVLVGTKLWKTGKVWN